MRRPSLAVRTEDLKTYRDVIEHSVVGMGRDDVAIAEVGEMRKDVLAVKFSRGTHSAVEEMPVEALRGRGQTNQALVKAIRGLSKEVSREAMGKAVSHLISAQCTEVGSTVCPFGRGSVFVGESLRRQGLAE